MAVLIEGMEMPKACLACDFCNPFTEEPYCRRLMKVTPKTTTLPDCPFTEVPEPHGHLIDADAVIDLVMQYCPDDDGVCSKAGADLRELLDEIENLPTIIPAMEEDEK